MDRHTEFKRLREALGLSQREIADVLGISTRLVRKYETDPIYKTSVVPSPIAMRVLSWMMVGFDPMYFNNLLEDDLNV